MIRSKEDKPRVLEIDLDGPDGNAFSLMGNAKRLARQLDLDGDKITEEMKAGDYEHLLMVFQEYFPMVTLWRT